MKPLHAAVLLFGLLYGVCLALHSAAVGPAPAGAGWAWYTWRIAGAACLAFTCLELVIWVVWWFVRIRARVTSESPAVGGVPLVLSAGERVALIRQRPAVAVVLEAPAGGLSEEQVEALAGRVHDMLLRTPAYSTFFVIGNAQESDEGAGVLRRVRRRLRSEGLDYHEHRLVFEARGGESTVCEDAQGPLLEWVRRFGGKYEYVFVLGADGWLPAEDPRRPETCDVLERLLVAMRNDPGLAAVETSTEVGEGETLWGALRAVDAGIESDYYFPVRSYLHGRRAPCRRRNCMLRVRDLAAATAGERARVLTDAVVTSVGPKDTTAPCEDEAPTIWRVLPAILTMLLLASVGVLIFQGQPMLAAPFSAATGALVDLVLIGLLLPKLTGTRSFSDFLAASGATIAMGAPVILLRCVRFITGSCGPRHWSATVEPNLGHALRAGVVFLPATLVGLLLLGLVSQNVFVLPEGASVVLSVLLASMIVSPLTAVMLSWPIGRRPARESDAARMSCGNFEAINYDASVG